MNPRDFSAIRLENSVLEDCESLFSTMKISSSSIFIINSIIRNMTGLLNTGGIDIFDCSLIIFNTTFTKNYGVMANDILVKFGLNLIIESSEFLIINNMPAINVNQAFSVEIRNTRISGNPQSSFNHLPDSVIILNNLHDLVIESCFFSNLNSFSSPIDIESDIVKIDLLSSFFISASNFSFCSSQSNGGVLLVSSYFDFSIADCFFYANIAIDSGGILIYKPLRFFFFFKRKNPL